MAIQFWGLGYRRREGQRDKPSVLESELEDQQGRQSGLLLQPGTGLILKQGSEQDPGGDVRWTWRSGGQGSQRSLIHRQGLTSNRLFSSRIFPGAGTDLDPSPALWWSEQEAAAPRSAVGVDRRRRRSFLHPEDKLLACGFFLKESHLYWSR